MYTIKNDIVYKTLNIGNAIVKKIHGNTIKTQINANNLSAITFKWLAFDLEEQSYAEDTEKTTPFQVDVAGQILEIQVGEMLEFSSDEAGRFTIKTINEGVGNDSVEVVIDG